MMELQLLSFFALFYCVVGGSSDAEVYWNSMLPYTPFPKPLKDLLNSPEIRKNFSYEKIFAPRNTYGVGYWPQRQELNSNAILNSTTVYFLYDTLQTDKKMRIIFTKSANGSYFLPCRVAQAIPFSSKKLPDIWNYFAVQPTSEEARIIKQTVEECEEPSIRGEDKHCATCLNSMVDFVVSRFSTRVKTMFNEVEQGEGNKEQEYTILEGVKMMSENQIVCHKQRYPFAVFYCHKINATKVYEVPLMGANGSKAKAAVVCHTDTLAWNPNHFAFQVLQGIKPGGPPICHLLNSDTIVWVPNESI